MRDRRIMGAQAVERPIEREYRNVISDNLSMEGPSRVRPGDIVVCTPPKCGTTWMQAIVAELLFPEGGAEGPLGGRSVGRRPLGADRSAARPPRCSEHRRSLKSHTPADGIPWDPAVSYIVVGRDGRDAFMSFLNHMRNMQPGPRDEPRDDRGRRRHRSRGGRSPACGRSCTSSSPGAWTTIRCGSSMWRRSGSTGRNRTSCSCTTTTCKRISTGEMRRVAEFLDIARRRAAMWPAQVERCTFASMKRRAATRSPTSRPTSSEAPRRFLYKGSNGRWHDVSSPPTSSPTSTAAARNSYRAKPSHGPPRGNLFFRVDPSQSS